VTGLHSIWLGKRNGGILGAFPAATASSSRVAGGRKFRSITSITLQPHGRSSTGGTFFENRPGSSTEGRGGNAAAGCATAQGFSSFPPSGSPTPLPELEGGCSGDDTVDSTGIIPPRSRRQTHSPPRSQSREGIAQDAPGRRSPLQSTRPPCAASHGANVAFGIGPAFMAIIHRSEGVLHFRCPTDGYAVLPDDNCQPGWTTTFPSLLERVRQ